jgi:hypothetical protein
LSWAAVIIGGASLVGSIAQSQSAKKAASKQVSGAQAGIDEQRRQFDLIMQMLQPQINTGTQALNTLNGQAAPQTPSWQQPGTIHNAVATRILGRIPEVPADEPTAAPSVSPSQPTGMDVFFASPDYSFRRNEGMRNIENSFAARGGAASGNALRALADFNSNLASSEFGNFVNRQLAMAGLGQAATSQGVNAAQYTGGNVANLLGQQADARASGIVNRSNAFTNGLNDLAGIYGAWLRNKQLNQQSP